jgi:hypothetical protein
MFSKHIRTGVDNNFQSAKKGPYFFCLCAFTLDNSYNGTYFINVNHQ